MIGGDAPSTYLERPRKHKQVQIEDAAMNAIVEGHCIPSEPPSAPRPQSTLSPAQHPPARAAPCRELALFNLAIDSKPRGW